MMAEIISVKVVGGGRRCGSIEEAKGGTRQL